MCAAFEGRFVEPDRRQHRRGQSGVAALAGMRGAGQRQLAIAEAQRRRSTGFDQRQRLDELDRRTREHRLLDVADRPDDGAIGIENGNGAAVTALDDVTAQHFDQHRINDHPAPPTAASALSYAGTVTMAKRIRPGQPAAPRHIEDAGRNGSDYLMRSRIDT